MKPIEYPERHHLDAFEGWIGLGRPDEALKELSQLPKTLGNHPTVLAARLQVALEKKDWRKAVSITTHLITEIPEEPAYWITHALAVRQIKGEAHAAEILEDIAPSFPKDARIRYNLACCFCRMGNLDRAADYLRDALSLSDSQELWKAAQLDPDLMPLRPKLKLLKKG